MKGMFLLLSLLMLNAAIASGQMTDWVTLSLVTFETVYDEQLYMEVKKPQFPFMVRELNGQTITLDGFIYPLEGKKASDYFVLSSLPILSCFFCGGGGPETVVEIHAVEKVPYTQKRITLKGELVLKQDDPSGVIYMLSGAEVVE